MMGENNGFPHHLKKITSSKSHVWSFWGPLCILQRKAPTWLGHEMPQWIQYRVRQNYDRDWWPNCTKWRQPEHTLRKSDSFLLHVDFFYICSWRLLALYSMDVTIFHWFIYILYIYTVYIYIYILILCPGAAGAFVSTLPSSGAIRGIPCSIGSFHGSSPRWW